MPIPVTAGVIGVTCQVGVTTYPALETDMKSKWSMALEDDGQRAVTIGELPFSESGDKRPV